MDQPGYILRQLWTQAAELAEDQLAEDIRSRLQSWPSRRLVPRWTTRRVGSALSGDLGRGHGRVRGVAVLSGGRVVTGGDDGRVLMWDPADPGAGPAELGREHGRVRAVAVLPDGRVITGGDRRVLMWDPADPGAGPADLGREHGRVRAVAVLPDGRVITGGDRRVLMWDPADSGAGPAELGWHGGTVRAAAILAGGRVVTGGADRRVLVWDPLEASTQVVQLSCSVTALATAPFGPAGSNLVIAHEGNGFSLWSFTGSMQRNS